MGVLGLAPADNVAAAYDPSEQILILSARGTAPKWTYGFEFKRLPWVGGLRFELLAWTGPLVSGSQPYTYSQRVSIPNLASVDPSGKVDVLTLNNPSGLLLPINWLGFDPASLKKAMDDNGALIEERQEKLPPRPGPKVIDIEPETVNAILNEPFKIKEPSITSPKSSLQLTYSKFSLLMTNAEVENGVLAWTFTPLESGRTQALVYYATDTEGLIARKTYNIHVVVLDNALVVADTLSGTPKPGQKAILDFAGRVFIALQIVRRTVPDAKLLRVRAFLPKGVIYPVTDPIRLSQLECWFSTGTGSATIESTGWAEFNPPKFVPQPIFGAQEIDITGLKVDIEEAAKAMRAHGITEAFWEANLERPLLGPEQKLGKEPFYVFHLVDGSHVWVGAMDSDVIVNPGRERVQPQQNEIIRKKTDSK